MNFELIVVIIFLGNLAFYLLYSLFADFKTKNKFFILFSYVLFSVVGVFIYRYIFNFTEIYTFFDFFKYYGVLISSLFDCKLRKKILPYCCFFISFVLNYFSLKLIMECFFSTDYQFLKAIYRDHVIFTILILMLLFNIFYSIYNKYKYNSNPLYLLKTFSIPLLLTVLYRASFNTRIMYLDANRSLPFAFLIFVALCVWFWIVTDKIHNFTHVNLENKLLKNQTDYQYKRQSDLEESYNNIREVKHNLKHTLLYIQDRLNSGDTEELKNDLATIIEDISDTQISYTTNSSLNFLLNNKLDYFRKKEIPVDIKVNISNDAKLNEKILFVVLGNILDNAYENFDSGKSEQKNLKVRITENHDNLYIKVSNPYLNKLNIKNALPITRKKDKISHGIGLKSIKNLLQKSSGYMKIIAENNIFTIDIILFDGTKACND